MSVSLLCRVGQLVYQGGGGDLGKLHLIRLAERKTPSPPNKGEGWGEASHHLRGGVRLSLACGAVCGW